MQLFGKPFDAIFGYADVAHRLRNSTHNPAQVSKLTMSVS